MALLLPGFGLFGTVLTTRKRKLFTRKTVVGTSILGLMLLVLLLSLGCGGSGNSNNKPAATSQVNVTVTGTSGAISHSSVVAITIN